jgi:hypothetical protein
MKDGPSTPPALGPFHARARGPDRRDGRRPGVARMRAIAPPIQSGVSGESAPFFHSFFKFEARMYSFAALSVDRRFPEWKTLPRPGDHPPGGLFNGKCAATDNGRSFRRGWSLPFQLSESEQY